MMRVLLTMLGFMMVCGVAVTTPGCSSQRPQATIEQSESIERPAQPIEEEEGLSDKVGQAGVAVLVVVIVLAGIILPLIFTGAF